MSTLAHRPFGATQTPPLRLLERRNAAAGCARQQPVAGTRRSLAERVEAWLTTWPEPQGGHRLGSWLAR